jgi:asparagine synthase (glutamine-hydrolysing)
LGGGYSRAWMEGFHIYCEPRALELSWPGPRSGRSLTGIARNAHLCAVLLGRLHYRSKLIGELRRECGPLTEDNDADLCLAVYRHRGLDGIGRLEGDFSLALWDGGLEQIVLSRDPMGAYPLFWAVRDNIFEASTSITALKSNDFTLDPSYIAEYLSLPFPAIQEVPSPLCVYKDVRRVMPGEVLVLRPEADEPQVHASWHWRERITEPAGETFEDISDEFSGLIRGAVEQRMGTATAAHFSGGMDSTSIALIARDVAASKRPDATVHALSLIYERVETLKRETQYIDGALDGQKGIVVHRVEADGLLPYDRVSEAVCPDEPYAGLFDLSKDATLVETACALGADTILAGHGGDDVFDVLPFHMADAVKDWRIRGAWRDATAWGRALEQDSWQIFRRFALEPCLPVSLQGGLASLLRRGAVGWRSQKPGTIAPWIRPEFARSHGLYERSLSHLREAYSSCGSVSLSLAVAAARGLAGGGHRPTLGTPRGIRFAFPFMDPRIVSLGLGVRMKHQTRAGEQKPLLAHAMRDVLPQTIRKRRGKGNFNEVYYRGISRNLASLETLIEAPAVLELGIFDQETLIACMHQTAMGADHAPCAAMRLDATLSLLMWLSMRERAGARESFSQTIRIPTTAEQEL